MTEALLPIASRRRRTGQEKQVCFIGFLVPVAGTIVLLALLILALPPLLLDGCLARELVESGEISHRMPEDDGSCATS